MTIAAIYIISRTSLSERRQRCRGFSSSLTVRGRCRSRVSFSVAARGRLVVGNGVEGLAEEGKDAAFLLARGGDHGPDAFTPTLSPFAPGSLRDVTVDVVGGQGAELRTHQASRLDSDRERGDHNPPDARIQILPGPVFRHDVRPFDEIDLWQCEPLLQGDQALCLLGGQLIRNDGTNVVWSEGDSFMARIPLQATGLSFASSLTGCLLLGLDHVAGRRLGRVGGVPPQATWSRSFWLSDRNCRMSLWSWVLVCSRAKTWERSRSFCRINCDIVRSLSTIDEDTPAYPASRYSKATPFKNILSPHLVNDCTGTSREICKK
jgi:hypothetical protein